MSYTFAGLMRAPRNFVLPLPREHMGYLAYSPWPLPARWPAGKDPWKWVVDNDLRGTAVDALRFEYIDERTNRLNMQTDWDVYFTMARYLPLSRVKLALQRNEPLVVRNNEAVVFEPASVAWLLVKLDELEERGIR